MRRISYAVVETERGFKAMKKTEWPDLDQRIHPPMSIRINTYPTREEAADACHHDASWEHIVAADAGHNTEIVCEV
jgi:hypothetical protein